MGAVVLILYDGGKILAQSRQPTPSEKEVTMTHIDRISTSKKSTITNANEKPMADTLTNQQGMEVEIPADFICPITLQLMDQPLVNKNGVSFERDAILRWLSKGYGQCPLTRTPMSVSDLIRNRPLEAKIACWRNANGIPKPEKTEIDYSVTPVIGFLYMPQDLMEQILIDHVNRVVPTADHHVAVESTTPRSSATLQNTLRRRKFLAQVLRMASAEIDSIAHR